MGREFSKLSVRKGSLGGFDVPGESGSYKSPSSKTAEHALQAELLKEEQREAMIKLQKLRAEQDALAKSTNIVIPRLKRSTEASASNDNSVGGRIRVNHACEPCRHQKTKCSGDRPVCKACENSKIQCYWADGKRDRAKQQFGSMTEKVADYEKLLRDLCARVGNEDADMIRATLDNDAPQAKGNSRQKLEQGEFERRIMMDQANLRADQATPRDASSSRRSHEVTVRDRHIEEPEMVIWYNLDPLQMISESKEARPIEEEQSSMASIDFDSSLSRATQSEEETSAASIADSLISEWTTIPASAYAALKG